MTCSATSPAGSNAALSIKARSKPSLRSIWEKLAGWKDFTIYTNGVGIYNTGRIRRDYVGGINTIAGIEAAPSVRLLQLWGEQSFSNDKVSIRFGQLVADSEFMVSDLFFCKATGRQSPHRTCRAAAQPFRCRRRASASK
jgi:hypothetical protein